MGDFPHVSRQPESVIYRDRDIVAYIPDVLKEDIATAMEVFDKQSGTSLYKVAGGNNPEAGQRILMSGRTLTNGVLTNGLRCAIYKTGTTATDAKVLREIISPRVTYNRDANIVVMWFWTNFESEVTEYDDTEGTLYWIDEDDFDSSKTVYRALCCTIGRIEKRYITGGAIDGSGAADGSDLLTVFEKPTILQLRPTSTGGGVPIIDFTAGGDSGLLYRAVADQSGNTIQVKTVDAVGAVTGDTIVLQVVT